VLAVGADAQLVAVRPQAVGRRDLADLRVSVVGDDPGAREAALEVLRALEPGDRVPAEVGDPLQGAEPVGGQGLEPHRLSAVVVHEDAAVGRRRRRAGGGEVQPGSVLRARGDGHGDPRRDEVGPRAVRSCCRRVRLDPGAGGVDRRRVRGRGRRAGHRVGEGPTGGARDGQWGLHGDRLTGGERLGRDEGGARPVAVLHDATRVRAADRAEHLDLRQVRHPPERDLRAGRHGAGPRHGVHLHRCCARRRRLAPGGSGARRGGLRPRRAAGGEQEAEADGHGHPSTAGHPMSPISRKNQRHGVVLGPVVGEGRDRRRLRSITRKWDN
jgi:hypothetical protein